jgi:hypothetical protein
MAARASELALSGLSSLRQYELFFRLTSSGMDSAADDLLADALFFDFCSREMPRQGKLPQFIAGRQQTCSWPAVRELAANVDLPAGSRVKTFRFSFMNDYRMKPWGETPVLITFVYASKAGDGLSITCL